MLETNYLDSLIKAKEEEDRQLETQEATPAEPSIDKGQLDRILSDRYSKSIPSDYAEWSSKGNSSALALSKMEDMYGTPVPPPPPGFVEGLKSGASFGYLGETEGGGLNNMAGQGTGIVLNIVGQTVAFKRAFGLGTAATRLDVVKNEIMAGLMADLTYSAVDTEDDSALFYGAAIAANTILPFASATRMFTKFDNLGLKVDQKLMSHGAKETTDVSEMLLQGEDVVDDAFDISARHTNKVPDAKFDVPSNVSARDIYKTQGEYRIKSINNWAQEHRKHYDSYEAIRKTETAKLIHNPKAVKEGTKAQETLVKDFLKGSKVLGEDKQLALRQVLSELDHPEAWDNLVKGLNRKGVWSDVGTDATSFKAFTKKVNRLKRQLETIEENKRLGLASTAGKRERNAVVKKIQQTNTSILKKMEKDEFLKRSTKGFKKQIELLTKDLKSTALSYGFIKSDEFQTKFVQSMAYFSRVEDPTIRKEAAMSAYDYIQKHGDKIERKLNQSIGHAFGNETLDDDSVSRLKALIGSGQKIDPEEYDTLRPQLAKYITRTLEDYIDVPDNPGKIRQELMEFDKKISDLRTKGDETELKGLMKERQLAKKQYIRDLIADPAQVKAYADRTGDYDLAEAADIYYASLGDIDSTNRILLRENQSIINYQSKDAAIKLAADPGDYKKGTTTVPPKPNAIIEAPKDLNVIRRLFGTMEVNADEALKEALKRGEQVSAKLFEDIGGWLRKMARSREGFLSELQDYNNKHLQPFYQYAKSRGDQFESNIYDLTDEIAQRADEIMSAKGGTRSQAEAWIASRVQDLSPEMKRGYYMFRAATDELFTTVNSAIKEHNDLVSRGMKAGKIMDEVQYRPGYTPYFYEGSYKLQYRGQDGGTFTHIVENRKEAVKMLKEIGGRGDVKGNIVLEPLMFDDASGMIQFTKGGMSIEDTFGIKGHELDDLFSKNKLNADNLHDVFWGAKLKRSLSLHDQKMGTEAALALASRFAFRFKAYAGLVQEGNSLVHRAKDLDLNNWANAIKTYGDDLVGRSRNTEKIVEGNIREVMDMVTDKVPASAALLKAMGISNKGRIVRGVTEGLTMLGRLTALGFSPAAALVQWLILPTNVAPMIGFRNVARGLRQVGKVKNEAWFKELMAKGGLHINPANIGMMERMDLPKALSSRSQQFRNYLDWTSMYMFSGAETSIRAATMLGARQQAKQMLKGSMKGTHQRQLLDDIATELGKRVDSSDVLDEYAVRQMKRTNFDFDVTGLSEVARNPLLKPFAQFKTYFFKEMEFLFGQSNMTHKERFISLGMFSAIGGMFALPGADEIDQYSTAIFGVSPKLWVMSNMPEVFGAGLGATIGMDMSGKASVGSFTRALSPEGVIGVAPSKAWNQYRSYSSGHVNATDAFLGSFSVMKGVGQAIELRQTGRVSDRYDQTLATKDQLGTGGQALLALGLPPLTISKAIQANHYKHVMEQKQEARDRAALNDYLDAFYSGDVQEASQIARESELSKEQISRAKKKRAMKAGAHITESMNEKLAKSKEGQMIQQLVEE